MISFIVPVKNGLEYTRPFVESVRSTNPGIALEWVVVDSGSTDGTLEYSASIGARVVPFRSTPFNYCAAVNAGAAVAGGDLWIVANNDLEFRSRGDLARVERLFRDWPLLAVLSPGRPDGEEELEFTLDGINGATWVVRPDTFRAWGGMPEAMSGYGYDEAYTAFQVWRQGRACAWLTGWDVHHYGSVTFGPEAGNVSPALRRNLSRLLRIMDASDLDGPGHPERILARLRDRELARAPAVLGLPPDLSQRKWLERQGFAAVRSSDVAVARVVAENPSTKSKRQWLPWLANELLLQPTAEAVGGDGWWAVRTAEGCDLSVIQAQHAPLRQARAVGPVAPVLMPAIPLKRPTLRQRVSAVLHTWRQRHRSLPEEW